MTTEEIKAEFDKMNSEGHSHSHRMNWLRAKMVDGTIQYSTGEFEELNKYSYSLTGDPKETDLQNIVNNL